MQKSDEKTSADAAVRRKLWWLIAGRLAATIILVLASTLWTGEWPGGAGRGLIGSALSIGLVVLTLSLIYILVLRFSLAPLGFQVKVQFFFDIAIATWLVWVTGDLQSPYTALYIVIISVASVLLGSRGALIISVGCAVTYTLAMLGVVSGVLPSRTHNTGASTLTKAVEIIGLNDTAFFVVGLLAARFAERQSRSDVQLIEATHALSNLRALHERIVESIRSGVVTTDLNRRIYTFNAAAEEITGYKAADVRGQDASILFGSIADHVEESLRAAAEGAANPRYEADCLTAEGLRLRLGYSISPLSAKDGEQTGLVITFQDLTQVRALEETSRRQDRLAAVGRVAAGIAHEIRNPLASMRGSIQVLRSEVDAGSAQAELMEIVLRESDRLNHIITDFLTYARPRPVSPSEVDVREPLRETFTLLRHSPEIRADHRLEEIVPDEPVIAMADAAGLRQVFWNLARNALQAMPDGGQLRAEIQRVGHGRLRITFTDTGRGMTPEQVERLFEPFSSSTTGGTGLGLSIVYQIVRDHGGTINARSREGQGTTITIELPSAIQRLEVRG